MDGKRLVLALCAVLIAGTNAPDAYAKTDSGNNIENEILESRNETYSVKSDPYLLDFFFGKADAENLSEKQIDPFSDTTPKERTVLDRWKSKQSDKWEALPTERFVINASAYTAAADECGKSDGVTASGLLVRKNQTLACPPEYPFGALIAIEGVGTLRCEDRGGAIKGNHFDIYMETKTEAFAFGRRNLLAEVVFE